jgi:hypothetical protein
MTEQPVDPTTPSGDGRGNSRPDVDDLNVAPEVAGPSGTGEQTDRGGDPDATGVRSEGETG